MLSIRTNLSSFIAKNSLQTSTNNLNQAIERMTTGAKINHAKDNAANYSINTNMTTKIGAYDVAADNVAMGMDMVTTATEGLSTISNLVSRLRTLAVTAQNGTYGGQSLDALQAEADALVSEVQRLGKNTTYNGVNLLDSHQNMIPEGIGADTNLDLTPKYDGFIANPKTKADSVVDALPSINSFTSGASGEYKIESAEDLAKLATMVNVDGYDTSNATFYLAKDIDLSSFCNDKILAGEGGWTPIGNTTNAFQGTFDGNGHTIKGLKIDRAGEDYQGLFGATGLTSTIKNVGINFCNINVEVDTTNTYSFTGALVGHSYSKVDNCFIKNAIIQTNGACTGGLIGWQDQAVLTNSYADNVNISSDGGSTGGLIGWGSIDIINCFSKGIVNGSNNNTGGLLGGSFSSNLLNCYSEATIIGKNYTGGLIGCIENGSVSNCYATGNVKSTGERVGGLIGQNKAVVTNCHATGNVESTNQFVGGLIGMNYANISNSYATGNTHGDISCVGGLIGSWFSGNALENCYALGDVSTLGYHSGGLIGTINKSGNNLNINNCVSAGNVDPGKGDSGAFIGIVSAASATLPTITIQNSQSFEKDLNKVGSCRTGTSGSFTFYEDKRAELSAMIGDCLIPNYSVGLQVGIQGEDSSRLSVDTSFEYGLLDKLSNLDITRSDSLDTIDNFLLEINDKQTELGAVSNRLESVLDEILIQHDNLVSSRSTIRDADMAVLSSEYIKMQILQQASATLMATANQSHAIALQLI